MFSCFTFMEALSSVASYWTVLFISPNINVSSEPDSAPFRAVTRSWKQTESERCHGNMRRSWQRACRARNAPNLLGESLVFEGDVSPLLVAASGQDVDDGLFVSA